jgi:hypothetical protein
MPNLSDTILLALAMTGSGLGLFVLLVQRQPSLAVPAVAHLTAPTPAVEATVMEAPAVRARAFPGGTSRGDDDDDGPIDRPDEKNVPRWLRPSVREARGAPPEFRQRDWR